MKIKNRYDEFKNLRTTTKNVNKSIQSAQFPNLLYKIRSDRSTCR